MQISAIKNKIQSQPILFLLALALSVRLYNINSPIIGTHSWRQSDTAAMARSFYRTHLRSFGRSHRIRAE